jgi:signal transduction histidine kinase
MKVFNIIFFLLFLSGKVLSESVFVFSSDQQNSFIGKDLYILEDKTNQLSFQEIKNSRLFFKSDKNVPILGLTNSNIWVRVSIKNISNTEHLLLDLSAPLIDRVEFYSPSDNGNYNVTKAGQYKPFNERKYKHPNYLLDINIPKGTTQTFYFKINSHDQIEIPIKIATTIKSFESITIQNFLFGIYAGLMLIMILYNLFIYFTVHDKSYLYYVLYIFSVALTQASFKGYTFMYIWPNSPTFETKSILLSSILVGYASVEFLRTFLNTKVIVPKLDKVFFGAYILYAIAFLLTVLGYHNQGWTLILAIVSPLSVYMLFVAFKIASKGYRTAKYFSIAWSIFLMGVFIYTLKDYGILPYNYFTSYTMPVGSAIETVLLSFALADRIKILQKDKESSQAEALRVSKENEDIIKRQNIILDIKVTERTVELQKSNEELNITLKNLKDTQSKLVDAEKMASLGQLTAGIAHEINNPINFVSSSVKPLKRDIADILTILDKYDELTKDGNVEAKIKEVNILKKELDLDYLKEEISTLLTGIDDGANRTAEIVKGLRNFSRMDEDDLKTANIHEGIDSSLVLLNSTLGGRIDVQKDYGNIPYIECYAGKLNQVFMNILTNATQAIGSNKSASGKGVITIKTFEKGPNVVVSIKDTGPGIPEELKNRIFEPFFTTKEVGEGTGLGLSIVFSIIEAHKGRIEVESEKGKGTEFIITLPKLQKN